MVCMFLIESTLFVLFLVYSRSMVSRGPGCIALNSGYIIIVKQIKPEILDDVAMVAEEGISPFPLM